MKFRNPQGVTIESRLPKEDENFYEDRYYTDVENVFIRIDPHLSYLLVSFPSISDYVLVFDVETMSKLAMRDVTILELLKASKNIESVLDHYEMGYSRFSDDFNYYIKLKKIDKRLIDCFRTY